MSKVYIPKKIKLIVKNRANGCCEYCKSQRDFSPDFFVMEHIIPLFLNGSSDPKNLAYACGGCNQNKATKIKSLDPITGKLAELFNPRTHKWENHFYWNDDFSLILGKTNIGRATVIQLDLNRYAVVNLRKVLYGNGFHPPD